MKKVIVTSCSQSQGQPMLRVTTSHTTLTVKPEMAMPHSTISTRSSGSSARHLRGRWVVWTSERMAARLLHVAHEVEDLHRVRAKVPRQLVLDRLADGFEAGLVD